MPDDRFGDDEFDPDAWKESADKKRRGREDNQDWPGKGDKLRALRNRDKISPVLPPSALPTGTAHQVELLLAKRQNRLRRIALRLGIFVVLPAFVVWFYNALIATPRYVCNFEVTWQSYAPNSNLAAGLIQSDMGTSMQDSVDYGALIYQYLRSLALVNEVDQQIDFRGHYSASNIDVLSRLAGNPSQPKLLSYWQKYVAVSEGFGGYLTVQVQGFDPAYTLLLSRTISADANAMIDGLNAQARATEVNSALEQLNLAGLSLKKADDALTDFRNTHGDLDPGYAATELASIVGSLESQLASVRAQLGQAEANLRPGASQIVQFNLEAQSLEKQIADERARLADSSGQSSYSDTVAQYNDLLTDQQFASETYQSAQQGLVVARADAASQQNYSVDFISPVMPDRPSMPEPLTSAFITLLGCLTGYGMINLLFAAFRDQSGL